ncbi:TPA: hypothetical protein ACU3MR_002536 [Staphylococcus aureus]
MTGLIKKAIPTDESAKTYLKNEGRETEEITPKEAKALYSESYIKHHKNFVCSTKGCNAPITCRSLKPQSKNSPTFQDQVTSQNLHAEHCAMHPKHRKTTDYRKHQTSHSRTFEPSGKAISTLRAGKGFQNKDKDIPRKSSDLLPDQNDDKESETKKRYSKTGNGNVKQHDKDYHLNSLQDYVELYKENPDYMITDEATHKKFPIKKMFRYLTFNNLFEKRNEKYAVIFVDYAYIQDIKDDKKLRVQFMHKVKINNEYSIAPSFFIEKQHLENEYPDIYDKKVNQNKSTFKVYTTLPLRLHEAGKNTYLNLASFDQGKLIPDDSIELKNNVYFS